jgi:hypothetical protein
LLGRLLVQLDFFKLFLGSLIALVVFLEQIVHLLKTFFVLLHAHLQVLFKLPFFCEYGAIVDLLDGLPFTCQLLLDVHNHVIPVPLACQLHVLDQSIAHLPDFDPAQYLVDLALLDSIPSFLQFLELPLEDVFLAFKNSGFLLGELLLAVYGLDSCLCLFKQAFHFRFFIDQVFDFLLSCLQFVLDRTEIELL